MRFKGSKWNWEHCQRIEPCSLRTLLWLIACWHLTNAYKKLHNMSKGSFYIQLQVPSYFQMQYMPWSSLLKSKLLKPGLLCFAHCPPHSLLHRFYCVSSTVDHWRGPSSRRKCGDRREGMIKHRAYLCVRHRWTAAEMLEVRVHVHVSFRIAANFPISPNPKTPKWFWGLGVTAPF